MFLDRERKRDTDKKREREKDKKIDREWKRENERERFIYRWKDRHRERNRWDTKINTERGEKSGSIEYSSIVTKPRQKTNLIPL